MLANTEILRCAQDDSHFRTTQHGVFGEPIGDAVLRFDFGRDDLLILGSGLDEPDDNQGAGSGEIEPGKLWQRNRRDGFIEEVLKIRTKSARGISLKLNRAQREYSCVVTRNKAKKNVVLKARQVGITTYIAARFFVQTITHEGTLSLQVTHDRESAEDVFRIVRRFWENLPDHAREGTLRTSHCNARQLVFPELDSEYCLASADENAGRGRTIQNLHCSEVSRWGREGDEALASLRAAVVPGGDIVLESTANGAWGHFYREWQRAEETGYQRHFFPWWYEESYVAEPEPSLLSLTEEEKALMNEQGLNAKQIAWRRQQWASLRGLAAQEFAEDAVSCFRASGECVFEVETVEAALKWVSEPVERRENGRLAIWLPAQAGKQYVIGADPAGGGADGDYSVAEVIDRDSGMQCAELCGHYPPREFALKVMELGKEYNTAMLAVERNNHGMTVLAHLETWECPNLYWQDGKAGWLTSVHSRPVMIANLTEALAVKPQSFRSERLLNECRTFVRDRDGRAGGAPGTNDDCVMAMGIAWAVRGEVGLQKLDGRLKK